METCRMNNIGGIERLFSDCATEARFSHWQNQSSELHCPLPRRIFNSRSDFSFDSLGSVDFDIIDLILTENESSESDLTNNGTMETDYFRCRSPPIRSSNPLINDPEFQYMHDSYFSSVKSSDSNSQRFSRSFSPSFNSSPKKRVEGFSPKSGRIVSALA